MRLDRPIWHQRWNFFLHYLREPKKIGALMPSSQWLAKAMLNAAPVEQAEVVVEFGPGSGVFTDAILARLAPAARLISFETDPTFYTELSRRIRDPRAEILHRSAADLPQVLAERGITSVDRIISGLPFNALPPEESRAILEATRAHMHSASILTTFQYTPLQHRLFHSVFANTHITSIVWLNLPPAIVYACRI